MGVRYINGKETETSCGDSDADDGDILGMDVFWGAF